MKAFLLAAGFGKRMGDLTIARPKPLLPVRGVPLIYFSLYQLYRWGVESALINLHYLGGQIEAALRDFPHFPLHFSHEPEILGTAGGLRKALDLGYLAANEWCVLLNPDTIFSPTAQDAPPTGAELERLDADALLYLKPRAQADDTTGFVFSASEAAKDLIQMHSDGDHYYIGYGIVRGGSVGHLPADHFAELGPIWRIAGEQGRLRGREFSGMVRDAGTRDAYIRLLNDDPHWHPVQPELQNEWREFLAGWTTFESVSE